MRVMMCLLALIVSVSSCGPSSGQIKAAKSAQYTAPAQHVLDVALQVAQRTYKIGAIDIEGLTFATTPQWYTKEGGRISPTNEGGADFVNASGGDVQVTLFVKVREVEGRRVVVVVTAKTFELVGTSPKPRELAPDDPNLPPWVLGRIDALAVEIYGEEKKLYPAS